MPQVNFNASGAIADGSTGGGFLNNIYWPKNAILMHTAPNANAIVGWTSPVTMTLTIARLHRSCGDDITWRLSDGGGKHLYQRRP